MSIDNRAGNNWLLPSILTKPEAKFAQFTMIMTICIINSLNFDLDLQRERKQSPQLAMTK